MIVPIHHSNQSCHTPFEAIIFLKQLPWGDSLKILESRISQFRWCGWADSSNKLTPQQLKQCLTLWQSHQLWASSIRLPELSGIVGLTYIISSHSLFVRFEILDMMFVNDLCIMIIMYCICCTSYVMSCHLDRMPCTSYSVDVRLSPTGPTVSVKPGNTKVGCGEGWVDQISRKNLTPNGGWVREIPEIFREI